VTLAAALAEQQKNVLLLDLDPQAHATLGFGLDPDDLEKTVYEAATCPGVRLADVLVPTAMPRLTLAPSSVMLAGADVELARTAGRELILGGLLKPVRDKYDVCVMDCAPSFGVLTIGALVAASDVIVPVQAHYYSLEGLRRVLETIRLIRDRFHPCSAENLRILLTLVEGRTTLSKQIQLQMREIFGTLIFQTVIHNDVRLCEAPSAGESVLQYAPRSRGAREYRAVAAEILGNVAPVEPGSGRASRRGIQKNLSDLFGSVLASAPLAVPRPAATDQRATGDGTGKGDHVTAAQDRQTGRAKVDLATPEASYELNLDIPAAGEEATLAAVSTPPADSDTPG
jgi:chromosome partitioning protein